MKNIFLGICLLVSSLSMAAEQSVIYGQSSTAVTYENNRERLLEEAREEAQTKADEICKKEDKKATITPGPISSYSAFSDTEKNGFVGKIQYAFELILGSVRWFGQFRETDKTGLALNVQYMVECK